MPQKNRVTDNGDNILSPDEIELKTPYAITIAPCDTRQYWDKDLREDMVKNDMAKIIMENKCELMLYMEVSRTGRLHWHGYIAFNEYSQIKDFYVKKLHKLLSQNVIEIDKITDPLVWEMYIQKQQQIMNNNLTKQKAKDIYNKTLNSDTVKYKKFYHEDIAP